MTPPLTFNIPEPLYNAVHAVQEALPAIQKTIVDTIHKIITFMKEHPYLVLTAAIAISLLTMSPWISYKWVFHAICLEAADMINYISYIFVAQIIYNIVKGKNLEEPSRNLLLSTSASILLTLCGARHYYWWFPPIFNIVSQAVTTLGIIAGGYLAQKAFNPLQEKAQLEPQGQQNLGLPLTVHDSAV